MNRHFIRADQPFDALMAETKDGTGRAAPSATPISAKRRAARAATAARAAAAGRLAGLTVAVVALAALVLLGAPAVRADGARPAGSIPNQQTFPDSTGRVGTVSVGGRISTTGAFFQSLGTNGRSCSTCHVVSAAMGLAASDVRSRFSATHGRDPLFAPIDGANCPNARPGDAESRSLLLGNGLIRIALPLPANAEFTITVVYDPYGCAIAPDPTTGQLMVSVYRRPLPATNLGFLSAVMWDGRETVQPLASGQSFLANLTADLTQQAIDATLGHAQAEVPPTSAQLSDIVNFELALYSAQTFDKEAGPLYLGGATGGPQALSEQPYYPGINDALGGDPTGASFDPSSMKVYAAWTNSFIYSRAEIAAGERLFDSAPLTITGVRGLNDNAALNKPTSVQGTCTTCHDAPNVANHSLPLPLDIGTAHSPGPGFETDPNIRDGLEQLSFPKLPVYLISGCPDPFNAAQPASFYTTDPGKALLTGQCADLNRIKGPILRGLAARAPYFHNGAAATLGEVVDFYNERFQMHLTQVQKAELVAFLGTL